jgi:hypothetical protein
MRKSWMGFQRAGSEMGHYSGSVPSWGDERGDNPVAHGARRPSHSLTLEELLARPAWSVPAHTRRTGELKYRTADAIRPRQRNRRGRIAHHITPFTLDGVCFPVIGMGHSHTPTELARKFSDE